MASILPQFEQAIEALDAPLSAPAAVANLASPMEPQSEMVPTTAALPAALERSAFEFHLREYLREFQPVGHIEVNVVRDLARHTSAIDAWNEAVGALQRQRAQRLPQLILPEGNGDELEDAALAAAVSAPEVHLSEQHGQRRSRAFYHALRTLQDLQA